MPNDLQLSDQDEVLLESLVLAASDNVTRAPGADRSQFAPTRRRVFVETDGNENVYLGTGNAWVDVSENTGLLSSLFGGGDGNFDSVNTDDAAIANAPTSDDDALRWQEGVETGFAKADGVDNSSGDDNWGQSEANTANPTFDSAFSSIPEIATGISDDNNIVNVTAHEFRVSIQDRSKTGFTAVFRQMAAVDNSGVTDAYGTSYIASEGR